MLSYETKLAQERLLDKHNNILLHNMFKHLSICVINKSRGNPAATTNYFTFNRNVNKNSCFPIKIQKTVAIILMAMLIGLQFALQKDNDTNTKISEN